MQEVRNKHNVTREKIATTLNSIIGAFESGNLPEAIALCTFPRFKVPANAWSLCNRIILFLAASADARGIRQWNSVGRRIKQGSKAVYIFAPRLVKKRKDDVETKNLAADETQEPEEKAVLAGFSPIPVFRAEDTQGRPLDYQNIKLPELPLLDVAKKWGIEVHSLPFQGRYFGYFTPGQICLASPEETVFFHELAHAAHLRVKGKLKPGQDPVQEIVAELSAQALAVLAGTDMKNTMGNSFSYIQSYAEKSGKSLSVGKICMTVLADVEKVLQEIFRQNI